MQDLHTLHVAPAIPQIHNRHLRDHIHILQQPARLFQLLGQRIAVVGPGKLRAPTIKPLRALTAMPTLTPHSYGWRALPLLMQSTSGACNA